MVHDFDTGTTRSFGHWSGDSFDYKGVTAYDLSADGGTVVATRGEAPYAAYLFTADTRTGAVRQEIPISVSGETRVAVSGDGSRIAYADTDVTGGDIRVAGATTLDRPAATMTTPRVVDLSMSADGTLLGALVELGTGHTRAARRHADGSDDWTIVSRTADGERQIKALDAAMSADGAWLAFSSADANVVGGDTNGVADVFTRSAEKGAPPQPS